MAVNDFNLFTKFEKIRKYGRNSHKTFFTIFRCFILTRLQCNYVLTARDKTRKSTIISQKVFLPFFADAADTIWCSVLQKKTIYGSQTILAS